MNKLKQILTKHDSNLYAGMSRKEIWADLQETMPEVVRFILELKRNGIDIETPKKYETLPNM